MNTLIRHILMSTTWSALILSMLGCVLGTLPEAPEEDSEVCESIARCPAGYDEVSSCDDLDAMTCTAYDTCKGLIFCNQQTAPVCIEEPIDCPVNTFAVETCAEDDNCLELVNNCGRVAKLCATLFPCDDTPMCDPGYAEVNTCAQDATCYTAALCGVTITCEQQPECFPSFTCPEGSQPVATCNTADPPCTEHTSCEQTYFCQSMPSCDAIPTCPPGSRELAPMEMCTAFDDCFDETECDTTITCKAEPTPACEGAPACSQGYSEVQGCSADNLCERVITCEQTLLCEGTVECNDPMATPPECPTGYLEDAAGCPSDESECYTIERCGATLACIPQAP